MSHPHKSSALSPAELQKAIALETKDFEKTYRWLEQHLPPSFLEEVDLDQRVLVARNLLSFTLQDCFSQIHLKDRAIVLCKDGPDADLKILKEYRQQAIRYYRAFVSNESIPAVRPVFVSRS